MFLKQFATKESSLSYFLGCGSQGLAIAVDVVAGDEEWFIGEARKASVRVTHVIDTHLHADHYSGGRKLAALTGAAYCLHESVARLVRFPFHPLHDKEVVGVGNVTVQVLHTPGHTPDSVCLLVSDKRRSEEPWFVMTGDTLFAGSVGRPDLGGQEAAMAGALFDSLHGTLLALPDYVEIYPGHQAGSACGAGLSGKPSSTIGFEKRANPDLRITDKNAFVTALTATIHPLPASMEQILAVNVAA